MLRIDENIQHNNSMISEIREDKLVLNKRQKYFRGRLKNARGEQRKKILRELMEIE